MRKLARSLVALVLASLLIAGTVPLALADTDLEIGGLAIVANTEGDAIMIREGAGYEYTVLANAAEGDIVTVLDGPFIGDDGSPWYQVSYGDVVGFVYASFLVLPENAPLHPTTSRASRGSGSGSSGYGAVVSGTGGDGARLRDSAMLAGAIILIVPEGNAVTVIGAPLNSEGYSWYPVSYGGASGYMAGVYLGDGRAAAPATVAAATAPSFQSGAHVQVSGTGGDDLRIRETYGLNGTIYGYAAAGAVLAVLDGPNYDTAGNAWYAVDYDGLSGFASASFLSWTNAPLSARQVTTARQPTPPATAPNESAPKPERPPAPPSNGSRGQAIVNVAMRYLGYSYIWGGTSPAGFDCSGFTMYVTNLALGVRIGRSVADQIGSGTAVNAKDLEPGDLVFFVNTYGPGLTHVGIYIGGGQMIQAGSERTGVVISNIWDSYWGPKFYAARRL